MLSAIFAVAADHIVCGAISITAQADALWVCRAYRDSSDHHALPSALI
jgi:hypothetical protein